MTEEEINKKAEKHCNEVLCKAHEKCYEILKCRTWRSRRAGFFCGYEQALKDCEKENTELRKEWQEQVQKANDEGYARTLQTIQLTKAKKLLKKVVTDFHNMDCVSVHIDKTIAEAEQFISEVEK